MSETIPVAPGGNPLATARTGIAVLGTSDPSEGGHLYLGSVQFPFSGGVQQAYIQVYDSDGIVAPAPQAELDPVQPNNVTATTAQVTGSIVPNEQGAQWRVEYRRCVGANCDPWPDAPPAGPPLQTLDELDDPTQPQPINVTLEDLKPNSNYEVRLFVRNSTAGVVSDPAQEFPTQQGSPLVETLKATSTSAFRATLVARVDPRNSDAEWWFELTSENGEAIQLPATPQSLDGEAGATLVTTEALNLEPETMYTYRVMARLQTDHETDAEGDSASFETRPAHESTFAKRGIELVSPVLTNAVATIPYMLSPDGNRAFFDTAIPLPDSENLGFDWRVSSRNEDGTWTVLPNKACAPMVSPG